MEMNIPKVEVLGFTVRDIQDQSREREWFEHRGIWFDARLERTERYALYEIPFFSKRCKSVRVFQTKEEVKQFLLPFMKSQQAKMELELS